MAIQSGTATVGTGHTYADIKAAFADVVSPLLGSLNFIISSDFLQTLLATLTSIDFGGNTLTVSSANSHKGIARQGFKTSLSTNSELVKLDGCTNGNIIFKDLNIFQQPSLSPVGPTKKVLNITGALSTIDTEIDNCIFQGGARGQVAISSDTADKLTVWTSIFSNYRDPASFGDGYGIEIIDTDPDVLIENAAMHRCGTGLQMISTNAIKINNSFFGENDKGLGFVSGGPSNSAVGKNNGTDTSGIGLGTETNHQNNLFLPDEFISLDPNNFNYLKSKFTGRVAKNGLPFASLEVSQNLIGIRGNSRGV